MDNFYEFKMNLQRFGEDDTTPDNGDIAQQDAQVNQDDGVKLPRIAVKDGQLVFLDADPDLGYEADGQPSYEDGEDDDSAQNTSQVQQPTQPEMVEINGQMVPVQELKDSYWRQSDYTRKMQEMKAQQEQLNALLNNPNALVEYLQRTTQTTQQSDEKTIYKQEFDDLKSKAIAEVEKYTGEQYNPLDDDHLAMFTDSLARKRFEKSQQDYAVRQKEYELQSIMTKYTSHPEWTELDRFAGEVMRQLPSYMADDIRDNIAKGNFKALDNFMSLTVDAYEKVKNPPKPNVGNQSQPPQQQQQRMNFAPRVESSGTGDISTSATPKLDRDKFSKGDIYDKMDQLDRLGVFSSMARPKK